MKYKYTTKDGEEVELERWQWVVEYQDGSRLEQFDNSDMSFHSIREVDLDRVNKFGMINTETGRRIIIDVNPEEMQIFHYYKHFGKLEDNHYKETAKIYVFGFKHRGSSNANYYFILPNDKIVIKNNQNIEL